jgi:hypothetical protein
MRWSARLSAPMKARGRLPKYSHGEMMVLSGFYLDGTDAEKLPARLARFRKENCKYFRDELPKNESLLRRMRAARSYRNLISKAWRMFWEKIVPFPKGGQY